MLMKTSSFPYKNDDFRKKIIDIWQNKKFQAARKNLLKSNRSFSPCNKCDVEGNLIGNNHANAWLTNL